MKPKHLENENKNKPVESRWKKKNNKDGNK